MSLWSVIAKRALGNIFNGNESAAVKKNTQALLDRVAAMDDASLIREAIGDLSASEIKELARGVLRLRAEEALEILRACDSCRELLSSGGYDPVHLLETLSNSIGAKSAQMDIDASGRGGSQRDQGYDTRIRFGPREFLTGTSLDGMTVRESQLQVILHELAHAAGDVIPPDGNNPDESQRNQQRITRACLPDVYERINH
ncbi:MAG: hypothetical protein ABR577_16915 [Pyrinomonadaceae bacterium]